MAKQSDNGWMLLGALALGGYMFNQVSVQNKTAERRKEFEAKKRKPKRELPADVPKWGEGKHDFIAKTANGPVFGDFIGGYINDVVPELKRQGWALDECWDVLEAQGISLATPRNPISTDYGDYLRRVYGLGMSLYAPELVAARMRGEKV